MYVKVYSALPEEACWIREIVFVEEQGFAEEFDKLDVIAKHFVLFQEEEPAATCRVYWDEERQQHILGRVAVRREFRRQGLGAAMIGIVEQYIRTHGGSSIHLHAQCRIQEFYEAVGYATYGDIEDDQGCPHIWMKKEL